MKELKEICLKNFFLQMTQSITHLCFPSRKHGFFPPSLAVMWLRVQAALHSDYTLLQVTSWKWRNDPGCAVWLCLPLHLCLYLLHAPGLWLHTWKGEKRRGKKGGKRRRKKNSCTLQENEEQLYTEVEEKKSICIDCKNKCVWRIFPTAFVDPHVVMVMLYVQVSHLPE